jgi:hypothetical protein
LIPLAATSLDVGSELTRLFVDLVAIVILAYGLFLRRHGRRDLAMACTAFNIGLFAVLSVISSRHIGTGLAFGLFAVLSIIRLRSEPFDNIELGYFFSALVIGLLNGLSGDSELWAVALTVLVLVTIAFIDHPAMHATLRSRQVTLDSVRVDSAELQAEREQRFGIEIADLAITAVDDVRETTEVKIRYFEPRGA